jgi:hypothetical protein
MSAMHWLFTLIVVESGAGEAQRLERLTGTFVESILMPRHSWEMASHTPWAFGLDAGTSVQQRSASCHKMSVI